jgi:hypothetical protein
MKKQVLTFIFSSFSFALFSSFAAETMLGVEGFVRLNEPQNQARDREWLNLSFVTEKSRRDQVKDFYLESQIRYLLNSEKYLFSVPEAYWRFRDVKNQLFVGRKVLDWNLGEAYWGLNNLNPQRSFQLMDRKAEGLTGILFKRSFFGFDTDFFMSYINIPQMNPGLDFEDGEVTSSSDWARLPPKRTSYLGQQKSVRYEIEDPNIEDIVLKKSLGGRIKYPWETGAISAFAIYKPETKIRANAFVKELDDDNDTVIVVADPIVNHHAVYGIFMEQKVGLLDSFIGIDVTDPNARIGTDFEVVDDEVLEEERRVFKTDDFEIVPNYVRESYLRGSLSYNTSILSTSVNFIQHLSRNIRGDDFFSDTVKYKQAVGLALRYSFSDSWYFSGDFRYDLRRKDQLVKLETNFTLMNKVRGFVGIEALKSPQEESYWSVYRANDTVFTGIAFIF